MVWMNATDYVNVFAFVDDEGEVPMDVLCCEASVNIVISFGFWD